MVYIYRFRRTTGEKVIICPYSVDSCTRINETKAPAGKFFTVVKLLIGIILRLALVPLLAAMCEYQN